MGLDASQDTGNGLKGYRIMRGLPRAEARNFILFYKHYLLPIDKEMAYWGVIREYVYSPDAKFESKDYPDRPSTRPIKLLP